MRWAFSAKSLLNSLQPPSMNSVCPSVVAFLCLLNAENRQSPIIPGRPTNYRKVSSGLRNTPVKANFWMP